MVNYRRHATSNAMLAQLRAAGVPVDGIEELEFGRFGWATDPDGNRSSSGSPPPGR